MPSCACPTSTCPLAAELRRLRERVDEMAERNRQLEIELGLDLSPVMAARFDLKLTPAQAKILALLWARPTGISYEFMTVAILGMETSNETLKVHTWHLRQKMRRFDIEIEVCRAIGYRLQPASHARLGRLFGLDGKPAALQGGGVAARGRSRSTSRTTSPVSGGALDPL